MRLLNAKTLELSHFVGDIPPYAILSHTWGAEEALMDTLEWVWVDTCCIDKTSSAELSEAINSMYAWYRDSEVCYVYLEDVSASRCGFPENEFRDAR
ncbi:vegetative incompatibility protein-like protein HET-E-1 [Parachaetomium inaequale]|uniref:Vegetative incompatibility protein-like protein HET-E-1 n=1 Tax=Parachaetomium inaequale TaxID=2588326 RepID=A0AAN6SMA5_9PEZI|nr:vegetative incompatibility protein-like protein HET-E-1 [Parachaetomium inaequale]